MADKRAVYLHRPMLRLPDGSAAVDPAEVAELDWLMRYGTPEDREAHRLEVATALSTLLYLTSTCPTTSAAQRKLAMIRCASREAAPTTPDGR